MHTVLLTKFFKERDDPRRSLPGSLAPIVFSWLAGRGVDATRLDPHDASIAARACGCNSPRCSRTRSCSPNGS